ncbi:protease inhibitor I42 family protein [Sandarakinorhabdus sp.]|uniref:protease inhibitor I42 family protein n=1 Tax=Sandarakinorhabdus sp. TaxID=1916663 RepID=UPI0033401943
MPPVVIEGPAGAAITLPLPRGPATGYDWLLTLPSGVVQIADTPPAAAPATGPGQLGDAAGGHVTVRAVPGRYRITARLARRWAPDQPVQTVEIDLAVK